MRQTPVASTGDNGNLNALQQSIQDVVRIALTSTGMTSRKREGEGHRSMLGWDLTIFNTPDGGSWSGYSYGWGS